MRHHRQDPIALHILHDILQGGSSTSQFVADYGISVFTLKRHLCELRHLGIELTLHSVGGQQIWGCRNRELVQSSALYAMWLRRGNVHPRENTRAA